MANGRVSEEMADQIYVEKQALLGIKTEIMKLEMEVLVGQGHRLTQPRRWWQPWRKASSGEAPAARLEVLRSQRETKTAEIEQLERDYEIRLRDNASE